MRMFGVYVVYFAQQTRLRLTPFLLNEDVWCLYVVYVHVDKFENLKDQNAGQWERQVVLLVTL